MPDVGAGGCFKDKAVIGVERRGFLLHLDCPCVKFICSPHMEQSCPIHVIAVGVSPVLEATGPPSSMHHHPPLEDEQEVIWLLILHDTHLDRCSTILVIKLEGVDGCSCLLILGRFLCCDQTNIFKQNLPK